MKTEARIKRDYEAGYRSAIEGIRVRLEHSGSVEEAVDCFLHDIGWRFPSHSANDKMRRATIENAWVRGYEQALLDLEDGKINLEEAR